MIWKVCVRGLTLAALTQRSLKAHYKYVSLRFNSGLRFYWRKSLSPGTSGKVKGKENSGWPRTPLPLQDQPCHWYYLPLWMRLPLVHFCSDLGQERKRRQYVNTSHSMDRVLVMCVRHLPCEAHSRGCWEHSGFRNFRETKTWPLPR